MEDTLIFYIKVYVKAQIKFSVFHKNSKAPDIKRCLAKIETRKTRTHCFKEEISFGNQSKEFQTGSHTLIEQFRKTLY